MQFWCISFFTGLIQRHLVNQTKCCPLPHTQSIYSRIRPIEAVVTFLVKKFIAQSDCILFITLTEQGGGQFQKCRNGNFPFFLEKWVTGLDVQDMTQLCTCLCISQLVWSDKNSAREDWYIIIHSWSTVSWRWMSLHSLSLCMHSSISWANVQREQ